MAEEKEARKSLKKSYKSGAQPDAEESGSQQDDDASDNGESSVGVNAVPAARALTALKKKNVLIIEADDSDEEEEPLLVDPLIPDLRTALDKADVWLHVLDARDPLTHRSTFIESIALQKNKKLVFLLNKIGDPLKSKVLLPCLLMPHTTKRRCGPKRVHHCLAGASSTALPHFPIPCCFCTNAPAR